MKYIFVMAVACGMGMSAGAQGAESGRKAQGAGGVRGEAKGGLQEELAGMLRQEGLDEAVVSICARRVEGERGKGGSGRMTLVDIDAEKMTVPASNMKLITTGAALHILGSDYRFETKIAHDGSIENGVLKGNLYIIGGGDPTTGSKDSIATSIEQTFAAWEKSIRNAGISRIEGKIIGDGRCFDGMAEHPTWLWNDIGTYYGAGATGLMFYENMQSFSAKAGSETGAPVNIKPSYPDAPWMEFRYECTTGKRGTGDQLYMYTSEFAPIAEIRGTFGLDRAAKRVDCSNKFPEYTCAAYFARHLEKHGIKCSEGPADFRLCRDTEAADSLTIIGSTLSPSLKRIAFTTNYASNNLYAETLYRTLGRRQTGSACYDSCAVAICDIFKTMGIRTKGSSIVDGSGLSRQNYISADFFCRFLETMMASQYFEDYLGTIPSPGSNGTLEYNMSRYPAALKARIKTKSGSMNGIRCYSGYILPSDGGRDGIIVFSIMVNNSTAPTWKLRRALDKIMAAIAAAN